MIIHIFRKNTDSFHVLLKQVNEISHQEQYFCSKSHSGNILVVAESANGRVGVDIEKNVHRSARTMEFFLKSFCSFEILYRGVLSETVFYMIWTAMESYYKYMGKGFYSDKNFLMDIPNKIIKDNHGCIFFDYVEIPGYTLCVCSESAEDLSDIKISFEN